MQKPSKLISVLSQVEICIVNKYEMCIFAWGQSHNIVDIDAWWWVLSYVSQFLFLDTRTHPTPQNIKNPLNSIAVFCRVQNNALQNKQ